MAGEYPNSLVRENTSRRNEFRTHTVVAEENGEKVIRKYASTQQALEFLKTIIERERKNTVYFEDNFDVLHGTLKEDYIEYEYLHFVLLHDLILQKMCDADIYGANGLLAQYVQRISSLETSDTIPAEFLETVGDEKSTKNLRCKCLSRGLFDLTPRNIMVDGNRWIVIDNEWSFDFPVPVVFILFRTIRETAIQLQSEIRRLASKTVPVINKLAYGYKDIYIPMKWLDYLNNDEISLSRMLRWEFGFKRYVNGRKCHGVGRIKKFPILRTNFPSHYLAGAGNLLDVIGRTSMAYMRSLIYYKKKLPDSDK